MGIGSSPKYVIARNGTKFDTWDDIKGKKIAIAPGSAVWFQFAATLVEKGIPYNAFNAVNIQGGGANFNTALEKGEIDAIVTWEPFESIPVVKGYGYYAKNLDYSTSKAAGAELGMLVARKSVVDQKREAVQRIVTAYVGKMNELQTSKAKFADGIARLTGLDAQIFGQGGGADQSRPRRHDRSDQAQAKAFNELGVIQRMCPARLKPIGWLLPDEGAGQVTSTCCGRSDPPAHPEGSCPSPPRSCRRPACRCRGFNPRRLALALILPLALVVAWQLGGRDGAIFGGALPTPDRVWAAWKNWAFGAKGMGLNPYSGTWIDNIVASTQRVATGLRWPFSSACRGHPDRWSKTVAALVDPSIQWLRPVPITAWLPISIAIFGISGVGAIFLITIGAFYPIVINTTQGARDVDRNWIRAALMMGAKPVNVLTRVVLPAAMPSIFTGMRIGSASAGRR